MFEKYIGQFLAQAFVFGIFFFGFFLFIREAISTELLVVFIGAYLFTVGYYTHKKLADEVQKEHRSEIGKMRSKISEVENKVERAEQLRNAAQEKEQLWKQTLKERSAGFPTLLNLIEELESLEDRETEDYLRYKKYPAKKAAEVVKEEARRRREAERENKKTQSIIEYYETIAPFLLEFKEELLPEEEDVALEGYTEKERQDPTTHYLAKEEYRKLSRAERNQMALDRFWKRPKSKWLIGKLYERYVGCLYEEDGYDVEYIGIFKGYEDLGRDLICKNEKETIVIQCKNWSQFKTIYEKHIFQFFGTVFEYKDKHPDDNVRAIFYTTTEVSDLARRFAEELEIELEENHVFDQDYPCIKCNVARKDGEKIYHLPFDQQYDNVKIEKERGEFYCKTVAEAEEKGFRRAFRWRGDKEEA